jgi:ParB-like chromosome segregation protein Spo0J
MAKLPRTPSQFTDYYQQFLPTVGTDASAQVASGFPERVGAPNEMGFLGRLVDIASRPLRIVSNPIMKALELPEKYDALRMEEAAGGEVSFGEKIAPVGSLLAAPFTGFFSDREENKPYWSDIVEKIVDVDNRNNRSYVDTDNNADPVAKGVIGFIGDVAFDPLSWVPGMGFIKVGEKSAALYNKLGKVTGATAVGKAAGKVATTIAERIRGPKAPEIVEDLAPENFEVFIQYGNGKKEFKPFDTAEEAQSYVDKKRAASKSASPWVELGEGQLPAGKANGYRISQKTSALPKNLDEVDGGIKNNIPASALGSDVMQAVEEAATTGGLTATEAVANTVNAAIKKSKLADGTPMVKATTDFIKELWKPQFETATQLSKKQKTARAEAPDFATWRTRTLGAIKGGDLEDSPITVSDLGSVYNREELNILRNVKTVGRALEAQMNMRNSTRVRQAIKLAIVDNYYQPYIKQIEKGQEATFTGKLLSEDPMQSAAIVREIDTVKEAAPKSAAVTVLQEKSRKLWGAAKDKYIAENKKRLRLPVVKFDFANPVVSTRADEMARVYRELESDPTNPAVIKAYEALVRESRDQYEYMTKELGIKVDFVDYDPYNIPGKNGEMVPDSKSMMEDVLNNKHLFVRSSAPDFVDNPHPILSVEDNDIFRAVHEFFGHAASGSNFRAAGEEGAWVSHSSMFSPEARRALTTETRGQNSYYNSLDPRNKQFAPQKAALFPEEFVKLPTTAELSASGRGARALTLLEKLNNLSLEAAAKAEMLFGPKLLADLRAMEDAKLNVFFDDVQMALSREGILPILGSFQKSGVRQELLARFGVTPEIVAKAEQAKNAKIQQLAVEPPKNIEETVDTLEDDALFIPQFEAQLEASGFASQGEKDAAVAVLAKSFNESKWMLDKDYIDKNFPDVTANGKNRNNPELGVGEGRNLGEANTHFKYTFMRNAFKGVEELFEGIPQKLKDGTVKTDTDGNILYKKEPVFVNPKTGKPYQGTVLADKQGAYLLDIYRGMETLLESKGISSVIDSAVDGTVAAMRISDILEGIKAGLISNAQDLFGLSREAVGSEINWYNLLFNNANTGVAYTKVMDAVAELIKTGDNVTPDDVLKIITSDARRNLRKDGKLEPVDNWLATEDFERVYGHVPFGRGGGKIPVAPPGVRYRPNEKNGKTVGYHVLYEREVAAAKLADALFASRTAFREIAKRRSAEMFGIVDAEIGQIVPDVADNFMRMARTPEEAAAAIRAAANVGNMAKDYGKVLNAFNASVVASAGLVRNALGDRVANIAEYTTRLADRLNKADAKGAAKARKDLMDETEELRKDYDDGAEKTVNKGSDPTDDPQTAGIKQETAEEIQENKTSTTFRKEQSEGFASVKTGVFGFLNPLNRALNAKYGMNTKEYLWGWMTHHGQGIAMRDFINERIKSLGVLSQKHSKMLDANTPVLTRAWDLIRRGIRPTASEPEVLAAWSDLMRHGSKMFNVGPNAVDNILGNQMFRTGAGVDYINDTLSHYRVLGDDVTPPGGIYINIDEARNVAKAKGITFLEAAADQWRTWPVKDPVDFLARMNAASIRMASDVAFVEKFIARAKTEGLAFSKKAEGLVPLRPKGESRYGRLFQEDVYVPEEIAAIFQRIDEVSRESRALESELGKFINRTLDPITNTWKYAITLPRPGHHLRNLNGDLSFTFFAEGLSQFASSASDAFKVLSLENKYEGVDFLRVVTGQG